MTIDRDAMLKRLKGLPDSKLSEIIFAFELEDTIVQASTSAERAMVLIRAVQALDNEAWNKLESHAAGAITPPDSPSEPPKPAAKPRIATSKLPKGVEVLVGRDNELKHLDRALKSKDTRIIEFVAWGGVGKSALVVEWMAKIAKQ